MNIDLPVRTARNDQREAVRSLAALPVVEIARRLRVSYDVAYRRLAELGLPPVRGYRGTDRNVLAEAYAMIRRGETIAEAARVASITHAALSRHMRRDGVHGTINRKTVERTGRSALASALVDAEGISICAASRRVGVAPGSVRRWRECRGLPIRRTA